MEIKVFTTSQARILVEERIRKEMALAYKQIDAIRAQIIDINDKLKVLEKYK